MFVRRKTFHGIYLTVSWLKWTDFDQNQVTNNLSYGGFVWHIFFFLSVSESFSFISISNWGRPIFDHIRGYSQACEACFKLPATCIWTQAAKASLGRHRHTCNLPRELLPFPERKTQDELTWGAQSRMVISCLLSVLKCTFSGNNILLNLRHKHAELQPAIIIMIIVLVFPHCVCTVVCVWLLGTWLSRTVTLNMNISDDILIKAQTALCL